MSNSDNKNQEAVEELIAAMNEQNEIDGTAEPIPALQPVDQIEQLQQQLAEAEKRTLLAQADLENFRRRTRRDMQDQLRYASLPLMNDLLEAVDNLNRAIDAHEQDPSSQGLLEGVRLVAQQISTILENNGCKKIEAVGQPFDPNFHQAVQMQPSDEYPGQHGHAGTADRFSATRSCDPTSPGICFHRPLHLPGLINANV